MLTTTTITGRPKSGPGSKQSISRYSRPSKKSQAAGAQVGHLVKSEKEKAAEAAALETAESNVDLAAQSASDTPTQQTTGQQIVQNFKVPSSQFRSTGPSALVSKSFVNKSGQRVTYNYGSAEEQQAARDAQKNKARSTILKQMKAEDKNVLYSGLRRQQSISKQLRSGLVRPDQEPKLKAQLAKPAVPRDMPVVSGGVTTTNVSGGRPIKNLGYTITYKQAAPSADQIEKTKSPIKYHAKKYASGFVKGVGAGMLGYAASQTAIVGGAGIATGATISAVPAAVAVAATSLAVGAYYGVAETKKKYETFKTGGFGAVWGREKQRATKWRDTANKYSGEIVEGVAAVTAAVPTYISAKAYYGGATPVVSGVDKGKISRTGPKFTPTSKQTITRSFKVGSDKYVVKAQTTAKEKVLPSIRTEAAEKTKYTVSKIGVGGKQKVIKTVFGSGEVQLKPSGEFVRFQKMTGQATQMSIGQVSRGGSSTTPRFIFESTTGEIKGFNYKPKYSSFGYVERTASKAPPVKNFKQGQITLPRINERWNVEQASRPIIKPNMVDKINKGMTKLFLKQKGGSILLTETVPRSGIITPRTEITPVFGTLPATTPSVKSLSLIGFNTALGSKAALSSAILPGLSAGGLLSGAAAGASVLSGGSAASSSIEKTAAVNVSRVGSMSQITDSSQVTTGYAALTEPSSFIEPQTTPQPVPQPDTIINIKYVSITETPPVSTTPPGTPPFKLDPPDLIVPGLPMPSLPPSGSFESFSRKKRKKGKQPKGYTPSATSLAFGIKGKPSKAGSKTGMGMRPIVIPKNKKKGFRL